MPDGNVPNGFILLHRRMLKSQVWKNHNLSRVWIWCLLRANWQNAWVSVRTGRGTTEVEMGPGQFIFGRKAAARQLGMKESMVRFCMAKLEKAENLTIQPATHYSVVTITQWGAYQIVPSENSQPNSQASANQAPTKRQPSATDKNSEEGLRRVRVPPLTPPTENQAPDVPPIAQQLDDAFEARTDREAPGESTVIDPADTTRPMDDGNRGKIMHEVLRRKHFKRGGIRDIDYQKWEREVNCTCDALEAHYGDLGLLAAQLDPLNREWFIHSWQAWEFRKAALELYERQPDAKPRPRYDPVIAKWIEGWPAGTEVPEGGY